MGQYYKIINADKKEVFYPFAGTHLMGFSWHEGDTPCALMGLLVDRWRGNRVYVVGDYACERNATPNYAVEIKALGQELHLQNHKKDSEIYAATYGWKNVENEAKQAIEIGIQIRYIYNLALGLFVDLAHLPVNNVYIPEPQDPEKHYVYKIAPLPLLLAMGNEQGNGDYSGANKGLMGSWCPTVRSLELSAMPRLDHENFFEFHPDFYRGREYIPWTDEKLAIRKAMKAAQTVIMMRRENG